jgi:DNA-binding protein H-NS
MAKSYQDYQKEIAELQKKAEEARRAELTGAIAQIKSLMAQFNLSIKDLKLKDGKVSRAPGKAVAAKYRDPATGETWSGRGRSPTWVIKAKAENRLDALIIPIANSTPAKAPIKAAPKKSAQKKTVAKPAVKKPAQRKPTAKLAELPVAAASKE